MLSSLPAAHITRTLIAPCGMDCALCMAHQRDVNHCAGCNAPNDQKAGYCTRCFIKNCKELKAAEKKFCFSSCSQFPCNRLRMLDKRYRAKYGMSMIDNLIAIEKNGVNSFVKNERLRWECSNCGNLVSVHRPNCLFCGAIKENH